MKSIISRDELMVLLGKEIVRRGYSADWLVDAPISCFVDGLIVSLPNRIEIDLQVPNKGCNNE